MSEKVEFFMVNVTIIEGRHLAWPNMDSAVHVRVDNQRKCTAVRYSTDCPFFNEYFAFEFTTTLQTLMDKSITLTVIQPRKVWRSNKTLGYITLDVATVWAQTDHQFYHKWAVISAPIDDSAGGPRGYVKVDINILRKGEPPKIPTIDPQETDEIEGNLLLPEGMTTERQRASYVFRIYRGENLSKGKFLDSKMAPPPEKDPPSAYIEVFFAGLKGRTSTVKGTLNPVWNESLILTELFPPLCQRIKIHLCYADACNDTIFSVHHINLRSISNDGEHGFLPTFGPTFVHFYRKGNSCEGYVGKVLMSFSTNLQVNAIGLAKSVHVEQIPALPEINLWKSEGLLLYGIILDANLIEKKYSDKPISYEINFGHSELQIGTIGGGDGAVSNGTSPLAPLTKEKLYWYLEYGQDKPCVSIQSRWPDFRKRIFSSNMVAKIVEDLKLRLDGIEALFVKEDFEFSGQKIENLLLDASDFLLSACRKYIDINQGNSAGPETELDRERRKLCLREMEDIENSVKSIYNPRMKKSCFVRLQDLLERLELLAENAQDCWPDVYIIMVSGSKKVAFSKCSVRDIVYSVVDEEKGKYCGKIQNLFLQASSKKPNSAVSCKLDIFLWIGLQRHKSACLEACPEGFAPPSDLPLDVLPSFLVAQEKHYFQCRAHIYQGKFLPGSDKSGLCDPFARVVIGNDCRETAVSSATLNPVWDQTLMYRKFAIYGAKSHIEANPPLIVVEVFDQDECCRSEFIGRCTFKPVIKFLEEPYKAPNFPPKLHWCKIYKNAKVLGEVLAAAEILERSEKADEADLKPSNEIARIPSDIKPALVKYRMEVIFWGVRDLQKIYLLPITKPKVTIECGYVVLHSDTILNVGKSLNFTQANKRIDISLPDQEEYAPPVCIKLFDCRSFGRYTLAGTQLVSVNHFLYRPLTTQERNRKFLETKKVSLEDIKSKHVALPMISIETEDNDKKSLLIELPNPPQESRLKQWLKNIFGQNKKPEATNQRKIFKKVRRTGTSSGNASTASEIMYQCLCNPNEKSRKGKKSDSNQVATQKCRCKSCSLTKKEKRRKTKTTDQSTTSGDLDVETCSSTTKKRKEKKERSTDDSTTSEEHQVQKSRSKSRKKNKKGKKTDEESTTSEDSKVRKSRGKSILKKMKKYQKKGKSATAVDVGTTSEDVETQKSGSKQKSPSKTKKASKTKKGKTAGEDTTDESRTIKNDKPQKLRFKQKPQQEKKKQKNRHKDKTTDEETSSEHIVRESCCKKLLKKVRSPPKHHDLTKEKKKKQEETEDIDHEDRDWWTKYYASVESNNADKTSSNEQQLKKKSCTLKIYSSELEAQPEFEGFVDTLQSFQMYKGKRTGDETVDEANITGIFKGSIKIYQWPPPGNLDYVNKIGMPIANGVFQNFASNDPFRFAMRVYCVKGISLRPKDINGRSDPYLVVSMGGKVVKDRDNYVPKQVDPIFGRCFELNGIFPRDHTITISVWDWDLTTSDDLIGETKIDIENRFYTRHRAHCGIASEYHELGYCLWRDQERPTQILESLCKKNNLDPPEYSQNCVRIIFKEFYPAGVGETVETTCDREVLALCALRRWQEIPLVGCHLVPEHVETRSLYHPAKPGVEQGKLQLWVDVFPCTDLPPPQQVDISPRKPVAYELRVIIWNTDDVILEEDDFFVGEKMSDIYVKGWLTGPDESQCTDVHYRSMTGEGIFNWRFVFPFKYLSTENKIVKTGKESLFSVDETEFKLPCRLTLQVWDNDTFSADDFLGTVALELCRFPRGARSAKTCTLNNLAPGAPTINLFKIKRTKGWWPFRGTDAETKAEILAGKVEAELELITADEAEKNPVGLARAGPQPLSVPKRPDTSFSWFRNPLKALKFLVCKHYRWRIIRCSILIFLIFGIAVAIYSFPGYSVKKLLHV